MDADARAKRWSEIDREIDELRAGKVHIDPAGREAELLGEQDRLEWEAGEEWFAERDCSGRNPPRPDDP